MMISRSHLHELIDVVDTSEFNILYQILVKFIPEDAPLPDEAEAIRAGRAAVQRGEYVRHEDINWN
jgi:predicted transcriptional regulator